MKILFFMLAIIASMSSLAGKRTYVNLESEFNVGEEVVWSGYYVESISIGNDKVGEVFHYIENPEFIGGGHARCLDLSRVPKKYFIVIGNTAKKMVRDDRETQSIIMEIIGLVDGKAEYKGNSSITIRRLVGKGERIDKCKA